MVKRTPAMLERSPRMDPFDEPVQSEQQAEEQPLAGSSTLPPALLRRSGQIETLGRDGKPQVAGQTDIEGAAAAAGAVDEESAAGAALVASSAPLAAELAACCALGMSSVSSVQLPASAPAFGGGRRALRFPGCAQLHPVRLISGLAAAVVAAGGQIYEGCKVCSTINKVVRLSTGKT